MPRPTLLVSVIVLVCAFTVACSGDAAGPADAECSAETTSVTATVTGTTSAVFNWTPACAVALLIVEEDGSDMWWISPFAGEPPADTTPEAANRITPSVTYGQVPAGMAHSDETLPLVPGRSYDVALWRVLPAGSQAQCQEKFDNWCLLTMKTFTR